MSSPSSNRCFAMLLALVAFALVPAHRAGATPPLRACVDVANPSAHYDRLVIAAVAKAQGRDAKIVTFNSRLRDDDDGFSLRRFLRMAQHDCSLIMGFPIEKNEPWSLLGLHHTVGYRDTGFVLAALKQPPPWKSLAAGTHVAVTYNTPANLFFLKRPDLKPVVYNTDRDSLHALVSGEIGLAVVWQPSLKHYEHASGAKKLAYRPLNLPHAKWMIAALYAEHAKADALAFDQTVEKLKTDGKLRSLGGGPQLFTTAQAIRGARLFAKNCAVCHGAHLEGVVGPALKGAGFASPDDHFTIGGMFGFFSQQMPAGAPGSLSHEDYAALMAFLLQENGYASGSHALTYQQALASQVPLIAHISQAKNGN